ncbi:hypothetical protein HCH_04702 [Hahella chejuensis KCTC 2396]|uniref:Uncharacterized protein n=1 Tax=Hahella chejuensis (strain KCTC 2396) TaxID=349521 RepID=Q2SD73_HAHCH|nr:hypothetical protein HCH_04702 [Hahella chejuensis KCTC 2396]
MTDLSRNFVGRAHSGRKALKRKGSNRNAINRLATESCLTLGVVIALVFRFQAKLATAFESDFYSGVFTTDIFDRFGLDIEKRGIVHFSLAFAGLVVKIFPLFPKAFAFVQEKAEPKLVICFQVEQNRRIVGAVGLQ